MSNTLPLHDTFVRRATVIRVVDGDTYEFLVDLGYRVSTRVMVRLLGLNSAELPTEEGKIAREEAERVLAMARDIFVVSYKDRMSFARWLADVYVDGVLLSTLLRDAVGLAPLGDALLFRVTESLGSDPL